MKFRHSYRAAVLCASLNFGLLPVAAQKPSVPLAPGGGSGTATVGSPTTGSANRNASLNNSNANSDLSRPIFLSGKVMFDDGSPANTDVRIERVCRGNPHVESHTDSKGNFSFQVGGVTSSEMSATDASSAGNAGFGSQGASNPFGNAMSNPLGSNSLFDCELRAAYPGYVSESISLANRHSLDDPNVGTILLHSLRNVKGTTISLTSALAPKQAQKYMQKGMQAAQKGKFEEAEEKFEDATKEYPKYAEAWFHLGQVEEHLNKNADATADYIAAIGIDPKYVNPYDKLAHLSASQSNWKEAEKFSRQAVDLNPVEFPSSFWYNAIANYNLKNDAEAEKSARSLVKLDRRHAYPDAERLLADLATNRGDLKDAAVHLRAYLDQAPNAKSAEQARGALARIEQVQAAQAK